MCLCPSFMNIVINEYYIKQLNLLMDKFKEDKDIAIVSCFGESNRHPEVLTKLNHLTKLYFLM